MNNCPLDYIAGAVRSHWVPDQYCTDSKDCCPYQSLISKNMQDKAQVKKYQSYHLNIDPVGQYFDIQFSLFLPGIGIHHFWIVHLPSQIR